jgi:hypothetical protein
MPLTIMEKEPHKKKPPVGGRPERFSNAYPRYEIVLRKSSNNHRRIVLKLLD